MLKNKILDYELIHEFKLEELLKYECLPIRKDEFYTYFYCSNVSQNLDEIFNCVCKVEFAPSKEIQFFLNHASIGLKLQRLYLKSLKNENNQNNIVDFLQTVFILAHEKNSSDIHFESLDNSFVVRFRIDGLLKVFFQFETALYNMVSSVIKLKCNLDITQKRKPLNGRFSQIVNEKNIDFRVSTLPTIYGESIVLRLLDEQFNYKGLETLGFSPFQYTQLQQSIQNSHGLILITGPTGSGKTTTLYSILHHLNQENKKIITIEDPVEYQVNNIQQVSVNQDMGLGFNDVLKHVLRQDPDIIMIGEIRDKESLQIALQASLTGHLVLSTLHTNDALSTLNRLYDLEAKPYIIASALRMIVSQRLILKACSCQKGCSLCNFTGFNGRVSISEVLTVNQHLSQMIHQKESLQEIMKYAKKVGFQSIWDNGLKKVEEGISTFEELQRVLGAADENL